MMFGHGANPVFFNKKNKDLKSRKQQNADKILTIIL